MDHKPLNQRPLHHKLSGLSFILILILGGFTIWSAFVKPTNDIKVEKGGTAIINQQRKRFAIPFVEVGVEQKSRGDMGTFIKAGVRCEF